MPNRNKNAPRRIRVRKARSLLSKEAKILLGIGVPAVLLLAILAFVTTSGSVRTSQRPVNTQAYLVRDDSPMLGTANAQVTVVEFLDPECPTCANVYQDVKKLVSDYDGRVRLVVRYLPLYKNSTLAMQAVESAGAQGKYWEMLELLFLKQPEWANQTLPQTDRFIEYALSIGLDRERFVAGLQNPAHAAKIDRDQTDAGTIAVRGTPTFFVNGSPVQTLTVQGIRNDIDRALRQ